MQTQNEHLGRGQPPQLDRPSLWNGELRSLKPKRILLPIDVVRCPLEIFSRVNDIARHQGVTVILLHVLHLNILAPENRVYEELARAAAWYLERLARACLPASAGTIIRIRTGSPAAEILAEARAEHVDLIILPVGRPSFWKRLCAPILRWRVAKVIRTAPCAVLVTNVEARFNCQEAWGRQACGTSAVPDRRLTARAMSPAVPAAADSSAPQDHGHRLAA